MTIEDKLPEKMQAELDSIIAASDLTHAVGELIGDLKDDNRKLVDENPFLIHPEIPLSDDELSEFIETFADNGQGRKLREWIEHGAHCEAVKYDTDGERINCANLANASVDFYGPTVQDSVLTCSDDLRYVYGAIMSDDVRSAGLIPNLTINGKEVPRHHPQS